MRRVPSFVLTACCLLWCTLGAAQQPRDGRATASASSAGTALVAGIVATDETAPAPVRGAIVTLKAEGAPLNRAVVTDEAGRFAFAGVAAGRYTLIASKPAYITTTLGAKRPGRPGTPFVVGAGQQIQALMIKMPRGAVITGAISDARGEAMSNVQVSVIVVSDLTVAAGPPATPVTVRTDDRGIYRVFGLLPGNYLVFAMPALGPAGEMAAMPTAAIDALLQALQQRAGFSDPRSAILPQPSSALRIPLGPLNVYGYAPVFFPGTSRAADATKITVGQSEERTGIDFSVAPVPLTAIDGVVTSGGAPATGVQLTIDTVGFKLRTPFLGGVTPVLTLRPGSDGRFKYTSVPPGTYTVIARTTSGTTPAPGPSGPTAPPAAGAPAMLWARAELTANGDDVLGLQLQLQPAMHVSGRVMLDAVTASQPASSSGTPSPPDVSRLQIRLIDRDSSGSLAMNGTISGTVPVPPAQVRPDGAFDVANVLPGTYRLSVASLPEAWWLRSAMVGEHDVLDHLLVVEPGLNVGGAVVTLSNRHTELSGSLRNAAGAPAPDYFVLVFPSDRTAWRAGARRVQWTRPASDGRFVVRDLPAGEYFLAALMDVEPADLADPVFLEQIVPSALRISIGDGETVTRDLRIADR